MGAHPLVLAVFAFAMVTVLIRRLLTDRAEKQRLAGELEAARTVQQLLFPAFVASGGEYAVDAVYEPSQEVGGDFYQVLDRADGSRLIVVGDVSGKGLKAAMLVSVAVGVLLKPDSTSGRLFPLSLAVASAGTTGTRILPSLGLPGGFQIGDVYFSALVTGNILFAVILVAVRVRRLRDAGEVAVKLQAQFGCAGGAGNSADRARGGNTGLCD